jgi:hypothetical protein
MVSPGTVVIVRVNAGCGWDFQGAGHCLADRLQQRLSRTTYSAEDTAFITRHAMFMLATADSGGWPQFRTRAACPGFVRVLDLHTLAFSSYDGNGMFRSLGAAGSATLIQPGTLSNQMGPALPIYFSRKLQLHL